MVTRGQTKFSNLGQIIHTNFQHRVVLIVAQVLHQPKWGRQWFCRPHSGRIVRTTA